MNQFSFFLHNRENSLFMIKKCFRFLMGILKNIFFVLLQNSNFIHIFIILEKKYTIFIYKAVYYPFLTTLTLPDLSKYK